MYSFNLNANDSHLGYTGWCAGTQIFVAALFFTVATFMILLDKSLIRQICRVGIRQICRISIKLWYIIKL